MAGFCNTFNTGQLPSGITLDERTVVAEPIFKYSDTWQLIINTATTILTFLSARIPPEMLSKVPEGRTACSLVDLTPLQSERLEIAVAGRLRRNNPCELCNAAGTVQLGPGFSFRWLSLLLMAGRLEVVSRRLELPYTPGGPASLGLTRLSNTWGV